MLNGFLVSELTLLSFGRNSWLCFKNLVWNLFLRAGLEIFVLLASANCTQSFGLLVFNQILKCYFAPCEVSNVLIFLFLLFCIWILICHSFCFLMVAMIRSWVLAHDFFAFCDKLLVWCCFDFLFRFNCLFKLIVFFVQKIFPHDHLDPTLSRDDTFIWIIFALFCIFYLVWLKSTF